MGDRVDQGRDAFDRYAWRGAYEHLSAAARDEPLEVGDLERLASSAYLAGHGEESSAVWAQAHKEWRAHRGGCPGRTVRVLARLRAVEQR